jgi:hypothetical protein
VAPRKQNKTKQNTTVLVRRTSFRSCRSSVQPRLPDLGAPLVI